MVSSIKKLRMKSGLAFLFLRNLEKVCFSIGDNEERYCAISVICYKTNFFFHLLCMLNQKSPPLRCATPSECCVN